MDELRDALAAVADGSASFETRAGLEHELLMLLRKRGIGGVEAALRAVAGDDLACPDAAPGSNEARFLIGGLAHPLAVTTFLAGEMASVSVEVEAPAAPPTPPDPRHEAFYAHWESLMASTPAEVAALDPARRAVFLVGLFEAEVMNGGVGQYLTNSEGVYVAETLACLRQVGAATSAALLEAAAKLGAREASYADAWELHAEALERIDEDLLDAGEDLAGLVADAFALHRPSGQAR